MIIALAVPLTAIPGLRAQSGKQKVCVLQANQDAPQTARQIQKLVRDGFYDGTEFYRVVKGHVIQMGGGDAPNLAPEFNKNSHLAGTVGQGRDKDVNSGKSEF
jgi:cyclophilin family peptidyl-prolyl cis-trans isomerase